VLTNRPYGGKVVWKVEDDDSCLWVFREGQVSVTLWMYFVLVIIQKLVRIYENVCL